MMGKTDYRAASRKSLKNAVHLLPVIPFALLSFLFLFLPLLGMMVNSFMHGGKKGGYSLQNYIGIFSKATFLACIKNSLYLSFYSALIGLLLSFITALAITKISKSSQGRYLSFVNMFSNFAGLPLAFGFMFMIGNAGIIVLLLRHVNFDLYRYFNLYSSMGLLLLFVYFQIPLGTLLLFPGFQAIKKEWKEAAVLMKAGSFQFWRLVGIPALIPSLAGTYGMLFANALTAFATPFMLMSTNYPLLPIKITSMYTGEMTAQPEMGSALSMVMIVIMLAVIGICNLFKNFFYKGRTV